MSENNLNKFFISIVLPSLLAIALFIISFYFIFLPEFEKAIMDEKKEMISELTNTAWSLFEEYENEYQKSNLSREEAQQQAINRVAEIRYGSERKDYFWIIDQQPQMIMHPYRPDLVGSDLNNYKDPNGKKLFVEAARIVEDTGEGFIDYMWQWKDDASLVVPKLSYVKSFEPWGWVIGTGIYLDDVEAEIKSLQRWLLRITLVILIIITLILLYVVRQSLLIEIKRKNLTAKLRLSEQKYKTLVEASTEGTIMFLQKKIIFGNVKFSGLSGYGINELYKKNLEDIFSTTWEDIEESFTDVRTTVSIETNLLCANGNKKNVVIAVSKVNYNNQEGYIISPKEVSKKVLIEKETEKLSSELQTSLLLMKQPIKHLVQELLSCPADMTIQKAAEMMTRNNKAFIFIKQNEQLIGIVTDSDLRNRALALGRDIQSPVTQIMTSPIVSIDENALLYEALLAFNNKEVSYLMTLNEDYEYTGVITYRDATALQQNTVGYFMKEIEVAYTIEELSVIHKKVPVLVNALVESGDKTANITRIITSITDAFTKRVIDLGIEKMGPPPCEFTFMVLGSEGRMEQTLTTDQDNAIIFEDQPEEKLTTVKSYFESLGNYISDSLHTLGYNYCKGGIMASNPKWTQPWSVWKSYFDKWMDTSDLESIVEAGIFFDFRGIYGNYSLIQNLRNDVLESVQTKGTFLSGLAQSVGNFKSPMSIFGNIVGNDSSSKDNSVDIKMILMPVTKFSRLYTLKYGIDETNTLLRIKKLYEEELIPKSMYDELTMSYNYLMQLRFRFQAAALLKGRDPDNKIDVSELTQIEVGTIKKIFSEVNNIPVKVNHDFKV